MTMVGTPSTTRTLRMGPSTLTPAMTCSTVLIDGKAVTNGTINYQASAGTAGSGSMHDPFFKDTTTGRPFSVTYSFTGKGFHTFELVNLSGPAYVDGFCITNATSSTMATAG